MCLCEHRRIGGLQRWLRWLHERSEGERKTDGHGRRAQEGREIWCCERYELDQGAIICLFVSVCYSVLCVCTGVTLSCVFHAGVTLSCVFHAGVTLSCVFHAGVTLSCVFRAGVTLSCVFHAGVNCPVRSILVLLCPVYSMLV